MSELDQKKIWRHFQGEGRDSFLAARPRLRWLAGQIRRWANGAKPVRVLNIGVGDGYFEQCSLDQGCEVHSLDPDEEAIAQVSNQGVCGVVGVIEKMPFEAGAFDVVVASEVLEHLDAVQGAAGLAEIARVLAPRGVFLGTVPYNEDLSLGETVCPCCGVRFHRWGHQRSFDLASMRQELEGRFIVRELRRTAFPDLKRGLVGKVKGWARIALAMTGQQIASPQIFFAASPRSASSAQAS